MDSQLKRIAIIYDDVFLKHNTGSHPEQKERLLTLIPAIRQSSINKKLHWFKPVPAYEDEILLIHTPEMLQKVIELENEGGGWLDPDTYASAGTLEAALAAAGTGKLALGLVFKRKYKRVFIPARPPGHHATSTRSMGFCVFNNAALCIKIALDYKLAKRVAVIDWDIHHGNGIEEIFYTNDKVLFMSVHQFPFFPGTGFAADKGIGKGEGFNINVPLPEGAGNEDYLKVFNDTFLPAIEAFQPDLFVVSAGFDGYYDDPLGGHTLNAEGYGALASSVREMAEKTPAKGRIISFLEGGYHPSGLVDSVLAVLEAWI